MLHESVQFMNLTVSFNGLVVGRPDCRRSVIESRATQCMEACSSHDACTLLPPGLLSIMEIPKILTVSKLTAECKFYCSIMKYICTCPMHGTWISCIRMDPSESETCKSNDTATYRIKPQLGMTCVYCCFISRQLLQLHTVEGGDKTTAFLHCW